MLNIKTVLKIATLNLCLGLKYKKDLVKEILLKNDIDILMMQEIEIESGFDCELLNIPGYSFEFETNNVKRRVGSYIKNSIKYDRCYLLEGENNHLLIINIDNGLKKAKRIINVCKDERT